MARVGQSRDTKSDVNASPAEYRRGRDTKGAANHFAAPLLCFQHTASAKENPYNKTIQQINYIQYTKSTNKL